ncbi:WYL domain-containing protein [Leucobacter sp. CSA1]|uniref:WYL domain-containing protein n=1 Tax=Leucobacter chromiisoli TaxID=2796471 RepID=A0A934Q9N4_9MICO|nr:WYL domain-containing protein [Leucobacter chromiisoli]MBK0419107.1 WYL domain-containing protein [Leucobacter chromiisoli]
MAAAATRSTVPGEQRVFSLVLALVASPEGVTKRGLLSSVYGYSDRFRHGEKMVALERQFERDKDQLRSLGIPIDTLDSPLEPGNTQLTRYRISKERLQIPSGLRFTERELTLLRLAALAWREGSLTAEARRATMKLEALGAGLDVQHLGVAPRIEITDPAAPALRRAIDEGRVTRFDYLMPGRDVPLARTVAPLRLHRADGRWHLIAHDLDRDADRVFLLSRIVGEVRPTSRRYDPGLLRGADEVVAELLRREREQLAVVRVLPGTVAEARLVPRAVEVSEGGRIVLGTLDYYEHALADELAGYGGDVTVLDPEPLRAAVIDRLRSIAERHRREAEEAGGTGGSARTSAPGEEHRA